MKSKLLVLLALLVVPPVATPDNSGTCDPRLVVQTSSGVEGEATPAQTVELVIPCVTKKDLLKVLKDFAPRLKLDDVLAIRKGKDVYLALSTKVLTRSTK